MLTIAAKKEVRGKSKVVSPVLFMTVEGEPMRFFVRPGQIKAQLQPYVKAGGGILCKDQEPSAILLFNPEDLRGLSENDAHRYVSIQYIRDCIEKNLQLDLDDYRLRPEDVQNCNANPKSSSGRLTGVSAGRLAYTPEEDTAILKYVSKRKTEVGGNLLWQEMEKHLVTNRSWQSMKDRYKTHLANRQLEAEEEEKAEGETKAEVKVEEDDETQIQILPCDKDAPSPQTRSANTSMTDLKQTDDQPAPDESAEPDIAEAQTSTSPQPEVPCLQPQTDAEETAEPQISSSPQPDVLPEDSPPAQTQESLPDTPSQKKQKKTQTASPAPVQPQRRSKRRQLELQPSGRQLRSSSSVTPQKAVPSPQPAKKARTTTKPDLQKAASPDKTASERATGEREEAVVEIRQEDGQDTPSETAQTDEEVNTVMEKKAENRGKRKEKKKLGILEMATKEFEDCSESDQDETTEIESQAETAAVQSKSTESPPQTSAASPQPGPAQESRPEAEAPSSSHCPEPACPVTAPTDFQPSTSKAHLFIFESESQEEDSQSVIDKNTASSSVPPPVKNKNAAFSLTQEQLEEDMQRTRGLMKQTNQDLVSVTKALLKTSGDFSAALKLLLTPSSFTGPFWNRHDDSLLQSADPVAHQQLLDKYGEEDVAKRLVFLEVER